MLSNESKQRCKKLQNTLKHLSNLGPRDGSNDQEVDKYEELQDQQTTSLIDSILHHQPPMPKFKRGGKVRVKEECVRAEWRGCVGTVQRVSAYDGMVAVLLSRKPPFHRWGAKSVFFTVDDLELVKSKEEGNG